ncbi:MAG: MATE family efflux transporter, partial [Gammaproteobacteria bacterium]|nr:MATE family efflux transporter [Gammaproteobacteria bacterium]
VPLGIAGAAAVLVGRAVGREDMVEARRAAGAGTLLGGGFMVVTACVFLGAPGLLARVYTADPGVLAVAVALLPIAGIFQVADGLQAVAAGVLRGAGDTRSPFIFNALGFWVFGIPVSAALAFGADMGARGLWWGLAAGLGAVAILLFIRVRRLLARGVERVVIDDPAASRAARPRRVA